MTTDSSQRARRTYELFRAALDVEADERDRWLDEACAGDTELRRSVVKLLVALDTEPTFLDAPAISLLDADLASNLASNTPDLIEGYTVLGVLGSGGMATVYEAEQHNPRRRVALKVMHRMLAHTSAAQRFTFEAQTLARLRHPNIAAIYEAGTFDDAFGHPMPYFAMEYVEEARSITDYVRALNLPLRERLEIFAQICDAVQYGHQLGIIHRDLKPSNILVGPDGRFRVIDFGIARSVDPQDTSRITLHTELGQLLGTLNFMSPEQCTGADRVDTRTDVYSLGVILYELITDRLPHDVSRLAITEAIRLIETQSPPRPSTINPQAGSDLDAIVATAMAKDARDRYQGAGALASDVRFYLAHKPIQARLPSLWHQAFLFGRRHRVLVTLGSALVLTAMASMTLIAVLGYRAWRESDRRIEAERVAIEERNIARRQAYASSLASAYSSYRAREFSRAREQLELAPVVHRDWEWSLVAALADRGESIIDAHDTLASMSVSYASRRVVTAAQDGDVAVWDIDSGQLITRIAEKIEQTERAVAVSQDGRTVYLGQRNGNILIWKPDEESPAEQVASISHAVIGLEVSVLGVLACTHSRGGSVFLDADTFQPIGIEIDPEHFSKGVRFSADGSQAVVWTRSGAILHLDMLKGTLLARYELDVSAECAVLSDDRRYVAAAGAEGRFRVWDVEQESLILDGDTAPTISTIRSLVFTSDSGRLFTGQVDRTIFHWSLDGTDRRVPYVGHDESIWNLAFDRATSRLISCSWDGTVRFWPIGERAASAPMSIIDAHDGNVLSVAFSPRGPMLASGGRDHRVQIWDATANHRLASLEGHDSDVYSVTFSPDGRLIASASSDSTVRLWSALTGRLVREFGEPGTIYWSVLFTPDNRSLLASGENGLVTIWDVESHEMLQRFQAHEARVIRLALSPDGSTLATCSRDGLVKLWDLKSQTLKRTLQGHRMDVFGGVFSQDASRFYSGSRDQTIRVWDVETGQAIATLDRKGQFITSLALHPDGGRVAAGSWYADVTVIDVATHDAVISFPGQNSAIRSLAFSHDGAMLACSGHDGTIIVYDARQRAEIARLRRAAQVQLGRAYRMLSERLEQMPVHDEQNYDQYIEALIAEIASREADLTPSLRHAALILSAGGDRP